MELGQHTRAARYLHLASRVCAQDPRPYLGFGRLFLHNESPEKAEEAFRMAQQRAEGCELAAAETGLARAIIDQRGHPTRAWNHCRVAIAAAPDDDVWFETATRIAPCTGAEGELLKACEQYLNHHPGDTRVLTCAAKIHLEMGRPHLARDKAEKAALLNPGNPEPEQVLDAVASSTL